MDWYYAVGDERLGPVDDAAFAALVASGEVKNDTLVWNETLPDWLPHALVNAPAAVPPPLPPPLPPPPRIGRSVDDARPPKAGLQRAYFILLLVELMFGFLARIAYAWPGFWMVGTLMQVIYWAGMGLAVGALWEQGHTAPRALRLCVLVPLVWGLCYFVASRLIISHLSQFGSATDGFGMIEMLQVLGYISIAISLGCGVGGLRLLQRERP